jgi:hypothetical protein
LRWFVQRGRKYENAEESFMVSPYHLCRKKELVPLAMGYGLTGYRRSTRGDFLRSKRKLDKEQTVSRIWDNKRLHQEAVTERCSILKRMSRLRKLKLKRNSRDSGVYILRKKQSYETPACF